MGWDLSDPKQYKKWLEENRRRAAMYADYTYLPGTEPPELETWQRIADRMAKKAGGGGTPPAPSWLKTMPSMVPWAAPAGRYARWGTPPKMEGWYAPEAQVEGQEHVALINRLLPYMAPADMETLARQLYIAGGGETGPFKTYKGAPSGALPAGIPGPPPAQAGGYGKTLGAIEQVLDKIEDTTARGWARAVFDVYKDYTRRAGVRTAGQEAAFQAQMEELFASIPGTAQPYAAAMQRLVQPTVVSPAREWYELREQERTAPTHWGQLGYRWNPAWM